MGCYSAVGDRLEDEGRGAGKSGEGRGGGETTELMKLLWVSKTKAYYKMIWLKGWFWKKLNDTRYAKKRRQTFFDIMYSTPKIKHSN